MGELDIRLLLRQLRDEPDTDLMQERLMEIYRERSRKQIRRLSSSRARRTGGSEPLTTREA